MPQEPRPASRFLTNTSFPKLHLKGVPQGGPSVFLSHSRAPSMASEVARVGAPGLASLRAVLKPSSGFLWPWVHGAGQGETPGLVRRPRVFPARPSRAGCSPVALLPHPDPSSVPDLCPSFFTLCSPSLRPPCFYPGLCQWHCLGKLRLDHLVFGFFSGHHHQFTLTFAWHSRPTQSSAAYLPASSPCPPPLTSTA